MRRLLVCQGMAGVISVEASFSIPRLRIRRPGIVLSRSDGVDPLQRWVAWGAMLTASVVPMIFSHSTGHGPPYSVPVAQALVLVVAAVIVSRSRRLSPLTRFLFTLAILRLGWSVIAPMLSEWGPIQSFAAGISRGPNILPVAFVECCRRAPYSPLSSVASSARTIFFCASASLMRRPRRAEPVVLARRYHGAGRLHRHFRLGLDRILVRQLRPNLGELSRFRQLFPGPWRPRPLTPPMKNSQFPVRSSGAPSQRATECEALWLTAIFFGLAHHWPTLRNDRHRYGD